MYNTCHLSDLKLAVCFIQMLAYLSLVSINQSTPGGGNFIYAVLQINLAMKLRNCYIKKMLTNMWINTLTSLYSISQSLIISDVIPFSMLEEYQYFGRIRRLIFIKLCGATSQKTINSILSTYRQWGPMYFHSTKHNAIICPWLWIAFLCVSLLLTTWFLMYTMNCS
jgi:hypothetical protein